MVMLSQRTVETLVGLFLLGALLAMLVLALKVSGLTSFFQPKGYTITAKFDDIGGLKVRSPVKIDGVLIGEVTAITLDPNDYRATVKMRINAEYDDIPDDSSASILTSGLLGDNYIAFEPMYSSTFLKEK
jgi:phospholipid/cholesterol/gamma-HCH transport system substrate-binding protein